MCYPIAIFNTTLCSEMRAMKHLLFCALLACSGVASAAALDWDITTADYVSAGGSDTSPGGRNYSIDCLTGDSFQLSFLKFFLFLRVDNIFFFICVNIGVFIEKVLLVLCLVLALCIRSLLRRIFVISSFHSLSTGRMAF